VGLAAHALVSTAELKTYAGFSGASQEGALEDAINAATGWLESEANRQFVTRGDVTEYHWLHNYRCELKLSHFPTIAVASIHESGDVPPVYDGSTLLVGGTDYQLDKAIGCAKRVRGGALSYWAAGYRAIKVVHSYGYRKTDGTPTLALPVPEELKLLCKFVAVSIFKESDRARWGISSVTDAQGSVTRFLGYLPPDMKAQLESHRRFAIDRTWELE